MEYADSQYNYAGNGANADYQSPEQGYGANADYQSPDQGYGANVNYQQNQGYSANADYQSPEQGYGANADYQSQEQGYGANVNYQQQEQGYGANANYQQEQGYGGNENRGRVDQEESDPVKQEIKEEIRQKLKKGFDKRIPITDDKDLRGLKGLYQLLNKARRVIDSFSGRRQPLLMEVFDMGCSKLPESLLGSIDQSQKNINSLIQEIGNIIKNIAEESAAKVKEGDEEFADLFNCSFCKNIGHTSLRCPLIYSMLCSNCLRFGHSSRRCTTDKLEAEQIFF